MPTLKRPRTTIAFASLALAAIATAPLLAAVVSRDLSGQLELIEALDDGRVVHGQIVASRVVHVPSVPWVPFTAMTVEVKRHLLPSSGPERLTVLSPGVGEHRLSISPPEHETRVGEHLVLFLRKDAGVSEVVEGAYKLDSFAESYRTQLNRRGDTIVLGKGSGLAIQSNTTLDKLADQITSTFNASKGGK